MKNVVDMNIGKQVFTIDKDACLVLETYFDDIRSRLSESDVEALADIETRMAELFRESCTSPMQVVTLDMVRAAMVQMGDPANFGERCSGVPQTTARKLYRSRNGRVFGGVCGGLADYFGFDPTIVRLVALGLILFGGLSIWVYIVLWIVIPKEPVAMSGL